MASRPRLGPQACSIRPHRARRGLRCRRDTHHGGAPRRLLGGERREDVHHQCRDRAQLGRHDHGADGRGRDLEPRRRERRARLRDLRAASQARLEGLRHPRADVLRLLGAGGRTCSARGAKGFHQFLEILDGGRISVAAMGVGLAQGAYDLAYAYAQERRAVRPADRGVPGRSRSSSPTWRSRSRPAASSSTGPHGSRTRAAVRARGGDGEALHGRALAPRRRTRRSRSTAATGSWTSSRSRGSTATRRSSRSERARTRCSGW